jgi:asparagine synthase (glutamine-hydrolysing)
VHYAFVQPDQIHPITGKKTHCSSFHFRNSKITDSEINISLAEQALHLDLLTYLISILYRMDKMSMAAKVEARVPFLDHELVEFVMTLPMSWKLDFFAGKTKSILKTLARKRLPQQIVYRKKSGFGLSLAHWLRDNSSLGPYLALLTENKFLERGFVDPAMVISMVKEHRAGIKDYSDILWELINLELWCEIFIDQVLSEGEVKNCSVFH